MGKNQNPFGLHTVTPYLIVEDVTKLIDFLKAVVGGSLRGDLAHREDGSVKHAELQVGDSIIMMGEPMDGYPAYQSGLYVYVDDCDEAYKKALELGATSLSEPVDFPHGDRYASVKDFAGNSWSLVTHTGK